MLKQLLNVDGGSELVDVEPVDVLEVIDRADCALHNTCAVMGENRFVCEALRKARAEIEALIAGARAASAALGQNATFPADVALARASLARGLLGIARPTEVAKPLPPVGTKGTSSGYPGVVVRHYHGMLEVRLPGGLCCISASDFIADPVAAVGGRA